LSEITAPRRPTIMEVAHLAGVSHQTVSRYFRAPDGLKPATKQRVSAAVKELNYRPNLAARSMRTRQTGRLAVIIPAMAYSPSRMLAGASRAAHEAGYAVDVLSLEGGADDRTERIIELADSGQVDGIVSFAPVLPSLEPHMASGTTITISGDFDDEMRGIGELADGSPVRELIEHLADSGHRRFFHISGLLQFASARARLETYLSTIADLGLESVGVHEGDWTAESGYAAIQTIDETHRPTAIIAASDIIAAGAVRGAVERGWRVPDDVSITGWDDQPIGRYLFPSLTTVDVDLERLGDRAMRRLILALRGEHVEVPLEPLTRVIWRESTGSVSPS
jgi:DNA-binding LacI/PurR family transcriptional regulator